MELTKEEKLEILAQRAYDIGYDLRTKAGKTCSIFKQPSTRLLTQVEQLYKSCKEVLTDAD